MSPWLLASQILGLGSAAWVACAEWAPLAIHDSIRLIAKALLYLMLTYAAAFGITLWVYTAISLDEFRELVRTALRAALHALWFVPAMLLASPSAEPMAVVIGIVLTANAARLLISNRPPHRRMLAPRRSQVTQLLFGESQVQRSVFSKETIPAIAGAFLVQVGSFALLAEHPHWAASLVAAGVACWTLVSITRGAYAGQKRTHWLHRVLSLVMVMLFSVGFTGVRTSYNLAEIAGVSAARTTMADAGWLQATRDELHNRINPPRQTEADSAAAPKGKSPVRVVAAGVQPDQLGKDGIPGLILQPNKKRAQALTLPPTYRVRLRLNAGAAVSIPFTGEYHLFRESSAHLPPGSVQRPGSPMEAIYTTTNGTPMETDAYQELDPPLDFGPCSKIRMTLISGESFPGSATLILVGAEGIGEMGPEIFGMGSAPEETLEFTVPTAVAGRPVRAIRVVFQHNPMEASHSTRVAIQRFMFIPKGP